MSKYSYYAFYKPFGYLSQFTDEGTKQGLKHLITDIKDDVYPVGRLDADSEGLLILSNDTRVNKQLLDSSHTRTYYAQIEGQADKKFIKFLENSPTLNYKGKEHNCLPAKAKILEKEPTLPPRNPPIRFRKNVPTTWVALSLNEGKNRQVRKMTAAGGFPTLRLVRYAIEKITIDNMKPGDLVEYNEHDICRFLNLKL